MRTEVLRLSAQNDLIGNFHACRTDSREGCSYDFIKNKPVILSVSEGSQSEEIYFVRTEILRLSAQNDLIGDFHTCRTDSREGRPYELQIQYSSCGLLSPSVFCLQQNPPPFQREEKVCANPIFAPSDEGAGISARK